MSPFYTTLSQHLLSGCSFITWQKHPQSPWKVRVHMGWWGDAEGCCSRLQSQPSLTGRHELQPHVEPRSKMGRVCVLLSPSRVPRCPATALNPTPPSLRSPGLCDVYPVRGGRVVPAPVPAFFCPTSPLIDKGIIILLSSWGGSFATFCQNLLHSVTVVSGIQITAAFV